MGAALPPKVFISYSHDSEAHRERVLALADRLRLEGIDVRIDRYVDNPSEGWPRWMERQLVECDFALLVCTPTYRRRFDRDDTGDAGKGAKYEAMIAEQILYEAHAKNEKLVPVLFEDGTQEDVPLVLRAYTRYQVMDEYDRLYGRLTGQHDTPAPALGVIRRLPPKARPGLVVSPSAERASEIESKRESAEVVMATVTDELLVDELARVIPIEKDARFVVERAGYPPGQIPTFHRAIVFWSMVVNDARNGVLLGGVRALVVAAARLAPGNAVFQRYLSQ